MITNCARAQGRAGTKVVLRYMPRQERTVELFDAKDGTYLGPAVLQNAATPQERREVRRAAEREIANQIAGAGGLGMRREVILHLRWRAGDRVAMRFERIPFGRQ